MGLRIPVGEFKNFTSGRRGVAKRGHDACGVWFISCHVFKSIL
jgi:hypothetical protein